MQHTAETIAAYNHAGFAILLSIFLPMLSLFIFATFQLIRAVYQQRNTEAARHSRSINRYIEAKHAEADKRRALTSRRPNY